MGELLLCRWGGSIYTVERRGDRVVIGEGKLRGSKPWLVELMIEP